MHNSKPLDMPTDIIYQWNQNVQEHFWKSDAMLGLQGNNNSSGVNLYVFAHCSGDLAINVSLA